MIIDTYEEWLELAKKDELGDYGALNPTFDVNLAHYLSQYVYAYVNAPTSMFGDLKIEVKTRGGENFQEIINEFMALHSKGNKIFLYRVIYEAPKLMTYRVEEKSFVPVPCLPYLTEPRWRVRYAVI